MKTINANEKVKVGDIFVNSWGYDQTNIDYFQVTSKTKKGIKIRAINSEVTETGFMCGKSIPKKNNFVKDSKEEIKYPYEYPQGSSLAGNVYVNFKYGAGQLWNKKPECVSWYA